jgi:hypothetical protein
VAALGLTLVEVGLHPDVRLFLQQIHDGIAQRADRGQRLVGIRQVAAVTDGHGTVRWPCHSSGTKGAGGACRKVRNIVSSRGAWVVIVR